MPDIKIEDKKSQAYLAFVDRAMRVNEVIAKAGILKGKPYPDNPKQNVGRVGGVNEAKYHWMSEAVDSHPELVDGVTTAVHMALVDPEHHGAKGVRAALKALRAALWDSIDAKGLVKTGFFRRNVKYQLKNAKILDSKG